MELTSRELEITEILCYSVLQIQEEKSVLGVNTVQGEEHLHLSWVG